MKKFRLPFGVQDYLPDECYQKNRLEQTLSGVFLGAGFSKVETGALEYYDLYDGIVASGRINRMFKLTDSDGSLLVLRPDTTLQISRMAATKLSGAVQKLYYIESSYEFLSDGSDSSARTREFSQAGIEILGNSGIQGDIEAVLLSIEALRASGLQDFLIDIGHINFFRGIIEGGGLSGAELTELERCINLKDALGTEMLLSNKALPSETRQALKSLNILYGGAEVLDAAEKLVENPLSRSALAQLRQIVSALKTVGYEKYISIDLGLLKGGYYSGLVIRGISKGFGVSILDGGRYDSLGDAFGKPREAVGFAIGTKRLLGALEKQGTPEKPPPCDYAYINLDGFSAAEFEQIGALRQKGLRVIKLYHADKAALVEFCKKNGVKTVLVFNGKNVEEIEIKDKTKND